jgi:hypothetical protein
VPLVVEVLMGVGTPKSVTIVDPPNDGVERLRSTYRGPTARRLGLP